MKITPALAERSIKLWRKWNQEFGIELYHEVGVMFVRQREMKPGDFEYESFKLLRTARTQDRAHELSRNCGNDFQHGIRNFIRDGVLEFEAGYAESGRVVATLIERAKSAWASNCAKESDFSRLRRKRRSRERHRAR